MNELDLKKRIDPLLKELSTQKSLDLVEKVISAIVDLIGVQTIERFLLDIPRVDAEISRFQNAPGFARQAAAYEVLHDQSNIYDLKLFWIKKTTKTNLSWIVGLTPNFEDSDSNDYKNIGIDFVVPESCDSLIILLSNKFKIRSLELKDHLTHTQLEIFTKWMSIDTEDSKDQTQLKKIIHSKLWESFNFEPINDRFYSELVESFSVLVVHLQKTFEKKHAVSFTTRLLGRLLFLWFLKKKNILNPKINYFSSNEYSDQTDFYRKKLEPLFFEVLNKEITDRTNDDLVTPYLNGGLFESSETDFVNDIRLTFPNGFFIQLFETLNKYNFTVDESSPEFQHVAIDPEMLGRIFESLLAEQIDEVTGNVKRKVNGTFYTPREVVNYMCEETVIEYLKSKLPNTEDCHRRLNELVRLPETIFRDQDQNKRRDWKPYQTNVLECLLGSEPITVLDPSVGSGAFPMGMLHVLVKVITRVDSKYEKDISKLKREILSKSLFGVDIDQSAIEICRLRAWLSIIVDVLDKDVVEPLPNLDFKFICANSLITLNVSTQGDIFFDKSLQQNLIKIRNDYFLTTSKTKKSRLQKEYLELTHHGDFFDDLGTRRLKTYNPFNPNESATFFDSELMLGVDKFDIVIGNPPYLGESGHKNLFREVLNQSRLGTYYQGKMDFFYFFYHLALEKTKSKGFISLITTNYFVTASGAIKLRKEIKDKSRFIKLINFNELKIFKSARGQHNIICLLTKDLEYSQETDVVVVNKVGDVANSEIVEILDHQSANANYLKVQHFDLFETDKNYIRLISKNSDDIENQILDKLNENSQPLSYLCDVSQGVVSGCDYVSGRNIQKLTNTSDIELKDGIFVFDLKNDRDLSVINSFSTDEKSLLRPFFKNSDIYHYSCSEKEQKYLLYINSKVHDINDYPNVYRHLKKFENILIDRREVQNERIQWFDLQWARTESLFKGKKIVVPYRAPTNFFGYTEIDWFCRSDVYLIKGKTDSFDDFKFINALLNSSLVYFWLYNKGKRKGEILELFPEFLNLIPINKSHKKINEKINSLIENLPVVSSREYSSEVYIRIRTEIDSVMYSLYGLNEEQSSYITNWVSSKEKMMSLSTLDEEI